VRLPINISRLEFSVVADAEPPRQYPRASTGTAFRCQPSGRVSAFGAVKWGEDRAAGPAGAGSFATIAETRERLQARQAELARRRPAR
jgi:hypothetical protein